MTTSTRIRSAVGILCLASMLGGAGCASLQGTRAEEGAAVLISSHQLELVERLCHRVLILHRGRRCAIGSIEEIRASIAAGDDMSLEEIFFSVTENDSAHGDDDA